MTRDRRSWNVLPNNRELGFIVITDPGAILFAIPEHSFASTLRAVAKLQFVRTRVITLFSDRLRAPTACRNDVVYAHSSYSLLRTLPKHAHVKCIN